MIIMSVLVGYSRIYLGHHFLIDVTFGAIIGVVFGIFSTIWAKQISSNPWFIKKIKRFKKRRLSNTLLPSHLIED
jgi:undecaprenyl-diphosphatase